MPSRRPAPHPARRRPARRRPARRPARHHALVVVACVAASLALLPARCPAADRPAPQTQRYRLIFNSDGHAVFKDANGDLDQWIENLFAPLENSDVDALFWCDGAGGNTANYDSKVLERSGARVGKTDPRLQALIDAGNDPPLVVVREARKRKIDVFYSFRINDIHDAFLFDERPTFKIKHPEWLIGKKKYGNVTSYETALNFAIPQVRELKYRAMEEVFTKYDFDGLEIDFLRGAPYFLPGTAQKHAHLLTELLTRYRKLLDRQSKKRGRRLQLAVRVDESVAACRRDGFEIARWIQHGLVDHVILGSGVVDIEVAEFTRLARPQGVHIYPCLYGWPSKYSPISRQLAAGTALNYWNQGASGIYLFNWFPHTKNNSESSGAWMPSMLDRLGHPAALRKGENHLMFVVDRGRPAGEYPSNWLHCVLPERLVTGKPITLRLRVREDISKHAPTATLTIQVDSLQADDVITATINGKPLSGFQPSGKDRISVVIPSGRVPVGDNRVTLALTREAGTSKAPRIARAVELDVRKK